MAKTKSPLLSIGASGAIGQSQVYGTWRGISYVRQHVVPSNPNTSAQQLTRNTLDSLMEQFKRTGPIGRGPWSSAVKGRALTERNQVIKSNLPTLRSASDMTAYVGSPGSLSGLPPTAIAVAAGAGAGAIDVTITSPQEPTGWTLAAAQALVFLDRAPTTKPTDFPVELEDVAPTVDGDTTLNFTGLDNAVLYIGVGWLTWTRPDGKTAYGASLVGSATTT